SWSWPWSRRWRQVRGSSRLAGSDPSEELKPIAAPGYFRTMTSVPDGYLAAQADTSYTRFWRLSRDHRRRTECSRLAAAAVEDRARDLLQQTPKAASHRHRVEGAGAAAQVFRRRPHELYATFPLQRNGPALCHIQRPMAQKSSHSGRGLPAASGRAALHPGSA